MPPQSVVLTEQHDRLVEGLVQSGHYRNAGDVVEAALRLIESPELEQEARKRAIKAAVDKGWEDIAEGRYVDLEEHELHDFLTQLSEEAGRRVKAQG